MAWKGGSLTGAWNLGQSDEIIPGGTGTGPCSAAALLSKESPAALLGQPQSGLCLKGKHSSLRRRHQHKGIKIAAGIHRAVD